jgi:hypothetical protein
VDRQQEVLALRRRLAELTGEVEPPTQMAAPAKVAKRRKGPDPDPASIDG